MVYKLYDDFLDSQTGFSGMFQLRKMTAAQIEFRQKLIDNDAAPHKVKQWPIKDKKDVPAAEWPGGALPLLPDPMAEFVNGEKNPAFMNEDAWEELYKDFATALREMKAKESRLSLESAVQKFIDDYSVIFGNRNLSVADLNILIAFIASRADISDIFISQTAYDGRSFAKRSEFNKFMNEARAVASGGVISEDFTDNLVKVIYQLQNAGSTVGFTTFPSLPPQVVLPGALDLTRLKDSIENEIIAPADLGKFKGKFIEIYSQINSLPKVKDAFGATSTGGAIITYMKEAEEVYDFNKADSPNFIDEKIEDELNPLEAFKKGFNDKMTGHLGRLKRRHDGWPYKSKQAETIVDAMYREGFTPQQGLDWILTNKDKVISRLGAGHEAVGRFKWLAEQLELAKKKEKKAFVGALYNGVKLKAIKEEMKVNAPKTGAKAKYKVASEILSVIQYEDFTTFSDQKMWEKPLVLTSNLSVAKGNETAFKTLDKAMQLGVKYGIRTGKVVIRKLTKLIAANMKTKRLQALDSKLALDKANADAKLAVFGVAAEAEDVRLKTEALAGIQSSIDEINNGDDGKELIALREKRLKIEDNFKAMIDSLNNKIAEINQLHVGDPKILIIQRNLNGINAQLTAYMMANAITITGGTTLPNIVAVPKIAGSATLSGVGIDTDILAKEAIVNPLLAPHLAAKTIAETDLTTSETNLENALFARGFEKWEYENAKYMADNAQSRIEDIAEMNTFDKELDATSRSLNIFRNIKNQRKEWYEER